MAFVRSSAKSAEKFVTAAGQRTTEYADGVANPRVPWAQAAGASESNYETGVQAGIAKKRFGKGVARAGDAKYRKGAVEKGTVRFGPGVMAAKDAYEQGVKPYLDKIASITLPPRFARRDPRNLQRVSAITTGLGQLKEQSGK